MVKDADTMVPGPNSDEPGSDGPKTLGPYEILEEIGRGGMGVVYRAFHPQLKRTVALKVLIAGEDASEEAITRFHREAESVAKLGHHPNIVPVYDIGAKGNRHYFAMHFVEGKPLDRLIDEGEVAPKRGARIARKLAEALHHAHDHGILHRDVKPANILVDRDGEPQITDFGLAKDVASESKMTRSGMTLGTPSYMPPEQADGRLDDIDERSDVYSLGATLYEMLTLQPPFEGNSVPEVLRKVFFEEPASPVKRNRSIDKDLETICLKCLEKGRARRYATCGALAEDLGRYLEGRPIEARPVSAPEKAMRWVRRHRAVSVTLAAAIFVLAAVGVGAAVLVDRESRRAGIAEAEKTQARDEMDRNQKVADVLLAAHAKLGRIHGELKAVYYDSRATAEKKRMALEERTGEIDKLGAALGDDPASLAAFLAVTGWIMRLGGDDEGALELFRAARESDGDVGWGYLFEAMTWLTTFVAEHALGTTRLGPRKITFVDLPEETEAMKKNRENFEAWIGKAEKATIWGGRRSENFARCLQELRGYSVGDYSRAEKGLTHALDEPAFSWIEEELRLARSKARYLNLDFEGGAEDALTFSERCPASLLGHFFAGSNWAGRAHQLTISGKDPTALRKKALEAYGRVMEINPQDYVTLTLRGSLHLELGEVKRLRGGDEGPDFARAAAEIEEALRLNPNHVEAHYARGTLFRHIAIAGEDRGEDPLENYQVALEEYTKVILMRKGWGKPFYNRANVLSEMGNYMMKHGLDPRSKLEEALADYDRALDHDPEFPDALSGRGQVQILQGDMLRSTGADPREPFRKGL
ncbi:MAG: protein kinase domain-containing protein, partial [Planctomycetota bacterium]